MSLEAKDIEQHIEQIRDERREAANTAKRVGSTMMEIFKYVAASVETALADISKGYLSKEKDDVAKGLITFLKGIKIDDIFQFDKDGNIIANTIASPYFSEKQKTGFAIAVVDTLTGKYKALRRPDCSLGQGHGRLVARRGQQRIWRGSVLS